MTTPDQNPMPNIVAVDPLAYLAERVKRGTDFVRVVRDAGRVTELCLTEHPPKAPEMPNPGEIGGVMITGYLADANLES